MEIAFCNASGVVGFGDRPAKGTLPIGRLKAPRDEFTAHCRLAYDGHTWLVPGVPEAADQTAGVDALMRFRERLIGLNIIEA